MKGVAFLALGFAGLFWGMGFPLGKLVLRETDAAHLVLLRFAVGAIVAAPFVLLKPQTRAVFRSPWVLAGGVLYGVAFLVQFEGLSQVTVSMAALLVGLMPTLVAVSARLMGERVSRASWAGVAAATLGAVLIAGRPGSAGTAYGVGMSLASLLIFLGWLFAARRAPPSPTTMAIPAAIVIVSAAAILPIVLIMHGPPQLDLSPVAWAGIVGQGVFPTLLATAAWQFGSRRVGSAQAGVFINVEPLMGAIIGVAGFGDRLGWSLALGGLLILAGSSIVVLGEKPAPPTPA